jgi:Fungal trichothecene efflux pump (TRI12)
LALSIIGLTGASFSALVLIFPYECRQLFGPDQGYISRLTLPCGFSIILGIIVVNLSLSILEGYNRELFTISASFMTAGTGALAAVTQSTPHLAMGLSFLGGLGLGGIIQPAMTVLTFTSTDKFIGSTVGLALSVLVIGQSVGYAVYYNVLQNKVRDVVIGNIETAIVGAGLSVDQIPGFLESFLSSNSTTLSQYGSDILLAAQEASLESYVMGFRMVYFVSIAFGGAAVLASLFVGDVKKVLDDHVAVEIK